MIQEDNWESPDPLYTLAEKSYIIQALVISYSHEISHHIPLFHRTHTPRYLHPMHYYETVERHLSNAAEWLAPTSCSALYFWETPEQLNGPCSLTLLWKIFNSQARHSFQLLKGRWLQPRFIRGGVVSRGHVAWPYLCGGVHGGWSRNVL